MKDKKSSENSKYSFEGKEEIRPTTVADCRSSTCKDCGTYRQMTEKPNLSYRALLEKTISDEIVKIVKAVGIIAISFLASVVNFSRLADFKEEQLYLETILIAVLFYLTSSDVTNGGALLFGGILHWFLAFRTKSKTMTVFIMTCLQAKCTGLRYYEWATMVQHIILSCFAVYFMDVQNTHYVSIILYTFIAAYFLYVVNCGMYFEDVCLLAIVLFAATFTVTSDLEHCFLLENLTMLAIWILLRELRVATGYSGLGFMF